VGVPLLARVTKTKSDYLIPEKGVWVPLTAVIDPGGKTPTMCLFDTTLPVCGSPFPLAADFSAPLARGFRDRQKEFQRTKALFNFDRFEEEMGIQRVFGFHPEKTPVVFVHGVFSSSTTWANAINCLTADPEIRKHFEFWNFRFPTGAPIPYLAQQLRKDVAAMHRFRCANGATSNRVVMVGHSMGGLMSKMLTQHSGEKQWNQFFAEPPEKLDVSRETRETLRDMFYFKPLPYVKCVIFTATPHRGSEATHWNIVQMLQPLIRTPETVLDATRNVLQTSVNALTPLGLESAQDFPNSLQHMEYNSRIGDIFADLPLNCDVTYHSIIGSEKGTDIPKDEMTDGVVSYKSAHIPGVESEIIVESGHGVQRTRAGIAEIGRIIKSER
jgi:pimeloyl-ACP methyl ester carboxylesterase